MTPVQSLALLAAAIILWRYTVHIVIWLISVPMLLLGWALTRIGLVQIGGRTVLCGIDAALWVNAWARRGQE